MLKFLIIVLVIIVDIVIGRKLIITDSGYNTVREVVQHMVDTRWADFKEDLLNTSGETGLHIFIALYCILSVLLVPLIAIVYAIVWLLNDLKK